jgi:S1-C subfamily serine protease
MTRRSFPTLPLAAVLAALGIGVGGGAAAYAVLSDGGTQTVVRQVTVAGSEPAASSPLSVSAIYKRAYKGVVELTVTSESQLPFNEGDGQRGQGSGFVYDTKGHVITNQHVVEGASSISVRFWNGATYGAEVVGTDTSTDLAVIKVDAPPSLLEPLTLGDSSQLEVGDGVVAIGSPYGLEGTLTSGIVSALHRQMTSRNDFSINDSIQTDAAINHGNSGGPLLNSRGRVVGVNAQIRSDSGGSDGVGFAIPSNTVKSIVSQILTTGEAEHAYLGIELRPIPGSVAEELDLVEGVAVMEVRPGTPAARAGLRAATASRTVDGEEYPIGGDVITAVDDKKVASAEDLQSAIDAKRPGDTVTLTYVRDGESREVDVKLASRPS